MRAEGATIVVADIDRDAGEAAADELGGLFVQVDVTDESAVNALFDTAADTYGSVDIAFNNAGISPPDDDSDREHRAGGVAAGTGRQPQVGVSVLPCGVAAHERRATGIDRQHRVVRRGDGVGDIADLLHRLQGRGAGDVA